MANNIVQHRRGTTEEWKKLDLVPSEGELVIEECADGTCKCKIGNGISKFSELAYLSDPLNARAIDLLTEQHQEDIISIVDKLTTLKDDLKTDLKCLETNTETKINALFVDEIRLNVNTLVSNVEQLETTVEEAKIASTDKFTKLEEDLAELHSIVLELPVDSSINESIENASQNILTQVDEKIKTEKENYETVANKIHTEIENDLIDLRNTVNGLKSSFSVQFLAVQDNLKSLLDTKFDNVIPALDSRIDKVESNFNLLEKEVLSKIQETYLKINEKYGSQIIDIQKSLDRVSTDTNQALSGFEKELDSFIHIFSNSFEEVYDRIDEEHSLYEDAMNKLAQVRSENSAWHITLNGSIDNIKDKINDLTASHTSMYEIICKLEEGLAQAATLEALADVHKELKNHLDTHEALGLLADISLDDIVSWRKTAFLAEKAIYVSDNAELCTGIDSLASVVLDCGTA